MGGKGERLFRTHAYRFAPAEYPSWSGWRNRPQAASKKRPAAVVSNRSYNTTRPDVVVMAITSQFRPGPALGEV
jgi:hypothetical protein